MRQTYQPLADEGNAMVAIFNALSAGDLTTAHLSGTFSDRRQPHRRARVVAVAHAAGAGHHRDRGLGLGLRQLDLVEPAHRLHLGGRLRRHHVAWAGTASMPDVDVSGTYIRIDGVIHNLTHHHTIYRDKRFDCGHTLSGRPAASGRQRARALGAGSPGAGAMYSGRLGNAIALPWRSIAAMKSSRTSWRMSWN